MEKDQSEQRKGRGVRRLFLNRWFIGGVAAVVIYSLVGFFLVPSLTRYYLERFATQDLKRQITIQKVRFNPYGFHMEFSGLLFKEGNGTPILGFNKLVSNFELSSLFHWAWTFSEIRLDAPFVNIQKGRDGSLNLVRIAEDLPGKEEKIREGEKPEGGFPRLIFQKVDLHQGQIDIIDSSGTVPADLKINPINVHLRDINTLPDRKGPHTLAGQTPDGETFRWEGEMSLNPLHSQGSVTLTGLKVATVWEFLRDHLFIGMPTGTIDIETAYRFDYGSEKPGLTLEGLGLKISGLEVPLHSEDAPILKLDTLAMKGGRLDLTTRDITIGELRASSGHVEVIVDETGELNWAHLVVPPPIENADKGSEGSESSGSPWMVSIQGAEVTGIAAEYRDHSRGRTIELGIGNAEVIFSGKIESGEDEFQTVAEGIRTRFRDMKLSLAGDLEPMLQVADMELADGRLNLKDRAVTLQGIFLRGGNVQVSISPKGEINWVHAFDRGDQGSAKEGVRKNGEKKKEENAPWSLAIPSIGLQGFNVALEDQRPSTPASLTLERLDLKLADVTGDGRTPLQFDLKVAVKEGGDIALKGHAIPATKSAEADLRVMRLALPPLQPYLSTLARLTLDSGSLNVEGTVSCGQPKMEGDLLFRGDAGVTDLILREEETTQPFAAWEALTLSNIHFSLAPNRLAIQEVKADKPSGKLIINEDRTLNLAKILVQKQEGPSGIEDQERSPEEKEPFPITVNRVRVDGGSLEFADLSLRPQFATLIHQLKGTVTGISSSREGRADMDLDGRVDEFGLARIRGNISPFDPRTYTDFSIDFRNVEMTNLTPYSSRFAGYRIASGKLSLDLKYEIKEGRLLGENQILIDQLTLGEKIESPDAVNLPLKLAVALLKDPDGKIDIGLPVKGSLDDPEFSFGHLIWKAIVNLLTKIVTSPFRALASLLGVEAENLDTIVFDPGGATLLPPEKEKLGNLSKALQKRPKLCLEVQGIYDPEVDGRALRSLALGKELAKREGLQLSPEEDPGPVVFQDTHTRAAIEAIFAERHSLQILLDLRQSFEKGLVSPAAQKSEMEAKPPQAQAPLPAEAYDSFYRDLYGRLLETTPLQPGALDRLARGRSEAVRQELLTGGEIDATRVIVLDPETAKESNEKTVAVKLSLSVSG